eukprot:617237-Alexandrium_andersonii.AAC.1
MSASLVGSEMCIRDRVWGQLADFGQRARRFVKSLRPVDALQRRRTQGAAVSYTHLTLPTICSV